MQKLLLEFLTRLETVRGLSDNTVKSYGDDIQGLIEFLSNSPVAPNTVPNTATSTDSTLNPVFAPSGASKAVPNVVTSVEDITVDNLREYIYSLSDTHKPASLARKITSIKQFFKYLKDFDYVKVNPAVRLHSPKGHQQFPTVLDNNEVNTLFKGLDEFLITSDNNCWVLQDIALFELLYATGLRISELCNLQFSNIDFQEQSLRVVGKGNKERIVPFTNSALESLKKWVVYRKENFQFSPYLFINKHNEKLNDRVVRKKISDYSIKFGIKEFSPHSLRHSIATHLINNNVDIRIVQELLGHSSLATTQKYTHISTDHLKKSYNMAHPRA
jgi:integrase/recombinase XerC